MRDSTVALWIGFGIIVLTLIVGLYFWNADRISGRIEGQLLINGKPAPKGVQIACEVSETSDMSIGRTHFSVAIFTRYAKTDKQGRFKFRFVRPGEARLGVVRGDDSFGTYDVEVLVEVEAGKTTHVTLGEGVVAVRARLLPPPGVVLDSEDGLFWREPDADIEAKAERESEAFQATPEGKIWHEQVQQRFYATISENGNFESNAVVPGRYRVVAFLPTPDGQDSQKFTSDPIEIVAPADGEGTPIDLGEIAIRPE